MDYETCRRLNLIAIPQMIEERGWAMYYNFGDENAPSYAYTIGFFETLKVPEIILFGINRKNAILTFNHIFDLLLKRKEEFPVLEKNYDILRDDVPVIFSDINYSIATEYFDYCNEYYQDKTVIYPAIQLIWPDEKSLFPWEPHYNTKYKQKQPLICYW